jgi:hypothetical protein
MISRPKHHGGTGGSRGLEIPLPPPSNRDCGRDNVDLIRSAIPVALLRKYGLMVSLLVVALTLGTQLGSWCRRATRLRQNQAQPKRLAKSE